jgi:hypothetical protein
MFDLNVDLTTNLVKLSQNNQNCKLLNIEDLIYHSSEQYLILCLKICNLIIKYKCNINTLIDINKYKQKFNLTSTTTTTTTTTTIKTINSTAISFIYNLFYTNLTTNNSQQQQQIDSNINYYFYNPHLINHDLLQLHHQNLTQQQQLSSPSNSFIFSHNGTLSLPYSSLTIPLLLLNLNETECIKYGYRESHKLSLFILGIILSFLILILNGLTLNTIIRTRRLHTITNILIANLSLSDFLSGCSFLYPCILNLLTINALETYNTYLYELACNIKQYYYICLVGYSPIITSMLSSIFTLTLLAFEKYIAILKPYLYETLCLYKNKLLPLLICLSWLLSIIISLLPIMGWNEYHQTTIINERQKIVHKSYRGFNCTHPQSMPCMFEKIFTLGFILLFTVICCVCAMTMLAIYIRIYIVARKHSKQIALQMTHFSKFKKQKKSTGDVEDQHKDRGFYRNQANKSINHKNYEKIVDNAGTSNGTIHQSVSLTTYVDLEILTIPPATSQQENCLLSSSSSSSISPSSDRVNKTTTSLSSSVVQPVDTTAVALQVSISTKSLNVSMKAMKTLLILLLGFYICWLPLIIYFLTFASQKYNNLTIYILMFVACCNAVIDPIVYAFRNREFYKALLLNFKLKN